MRPRAVRNILPKRCRVCNAKLVRRPDEFSRDFALRTTCGNATPCYYQAKRTTYAHKPKPGPRFWGRLFPRRCKVCNKKYPWLGGNPRDYAERSTCGPRCAGIAIGASNLKVTPPRRCKVCYKVIKPPKVGQGKQASYLVQLWRRRSTCSAACANIAAAAALKRYRKERIRIHVFAMRNGLTIQGARALLRMRKAG